MFMSKVRSRPLVDFDPEPEKKALKNLRLARERAAMNQGNHQEEINQVDQHIEVPVTAHRDDHLDHQAANLCPNRGAKPRLNQGRSRDLPMANEWDKADLDIAIEDFISPTLHPRSSSIVAPPIKAANFKLDNVLLQNIAFQVLWTI